MTTTGQAQFQLLLRWEDGQWVGVLRCLVDDLPAIPVEAPTSDQACQWARGQLGPERWQETLVQLLPPMGMDDRLESLGLLAWTLGEAQRSYAEAYERTTQRLRRMGMSKRDIECLLDPPWTPPL